MPKTPKPLAIPANVEIVQETEPAHKKTRGRKKGRQPGKVYCTAKGDTCTNHPCKGRTTCRMHGGTQKVGSESPNWSGKGHSPHVPKSIGERLNRALADPEILSQHRRISQMTARCEEIWDKLAESETVAEWGAAQKLWKSFWKKNEEHNLSTDAAEKARLAGEAKAIRDELGELLRLGAGEVVAWREFRNAAESARRLIESERRREVESQQVLTMNQVGGLLDMIAQSVIRNVSDATALRTIQADFIRLTGHSLGGKAYGASADGADERS